MDWPWITKVEVSGKEITMDIIGSDTVAGILFVNATYVIASGSILALAVVTFVACNARRRKRVSVETFEKLPA